MLSFVRQKIKNKIWLTVCLVLGLSFLVAAFSCQPMFEAGSLDKMLLDACYEKGMSENEYPTIIGRSGSYKTDKRGDVSSVMDGVKGYKDTWAKYIGELSITEEQTMLSLKKETCKGEFGSKGNFIAISYMPEIENHSEMLVGSDYATYENEHGLSDGIPCMISESVMDKYGLVSGEKLEFLNWKTKSGETLKLVIAGIYKVSDEQDIFWYMQPNSFEQEVFLSLENFDYIASNFYNERIYYSHYEMLDYTKLNHGNAEDVLHYMNEFLENDENFYNNFAPLLEQYAKDKKTVGITLWVLELPMLGLVLAFIYMVSSQIIDTEGNEIAQLRSRGFKRGQVINLYILQTTLLACFAFVVGIGLGYLLCKMAASTTDFLTFENVDVSMYGFVWNMLLYGLVAAVLGIVCVLIPVIARSGVTIVQQKANMNTKGKMLWEKFFFDIILLGVSLYLLHNFNQSVDKIRLRALEGTKMDPMIFLDSVLFIIALGLFLLRLVHYLVKFVYFIGRKRWKPATYASFLQITRNFSKQGFISVFMILTVALGLFNADAARTINQNHEDRIVYENGADVVLQENWKMHVFFVGQGQTDYEFIEPDSVKYESLVKQGLCTNMTRVMRTDKVAIGKGGKSVKNCEMMGINTKEFGETAYLKDELNQDVHWYTYLNELATHTGGIIISRNLADALEVKVGDSLNCKRLGDTVLQSDKTRGEMSGKIVAIVDAWPGYDQYTFEDGEEKESYLVVANYAFMVQAFKISPYEIWYKMADGVDVSSVKTAVKDMGVKFDYINTIQEDVQTMKESAMIRITNGMFTLSFIIAIILCGVGFLIYWISSIRQRELLFGVYRAMGMSVKEVNQMLTNEHIFSTLLSVLSGGICGLVSTLLFVKLFGIIYLPEKSNLAIYIYYQVGDVVKLFAVILAMILICMMILRKLVKSMNITQALKLGEE